MRTGIIWLGLLVAVITLIFHITHLAAEFEFVFLNIAVILIGIGVAPWGAP